MIGTKDGGYYFPSNGSVPNSRGGLFSVPVQSAQGVIGGEVSLPCPAMEAGPGDKLELVLWYRHDSSSPFYT